MSASGSVDPFAGRDHRGVADNAGSQPLSCELTAVNSDASVVACSRGGCRAMSSTPGIAHVAFEQV